MPNLPIAFALALSLAVGYSGVWLSFPATAHEPRLVLHDRACLDYAILHARMGSYRDTEDFLKAQGCLPTR